MANNIELGLNFEYRSIYMHRTGRLLLWNIIFKIIIILF